MGAHDDLHGFDEESLLQALRAPGSASELADEERYVAAFRDTRAGGRRSLRGGRTSRRGSGAARRLGAGTALAVVVGVSGGGVAAAYSSALPDPLQEFAHRVLGPVGAPPVTRDPRSRLSTAPRTPTSPSAAPSAPTPSESEATPTAPTSPTPTREPSKASKPSDAPNDRPSKDPTNTSSPDASPTPTPTPTPTPVATPATTPEVTPSPTDVPSETPSPTTPPLPPPAEITIDGGSHRVDVAQTTSISGVVNAEDGSPIPGTVVRLQQLGPDGWLRVATATSDESGTVTFESGPVTRTVVVRLRSAPVRSDPWLLVMRPLMAVSAATSEPPKGSDDSAASVVVSVSAQGAQAGDRVRLLTQRGGLDVTVAEGILDADGAVDFGLTQAKRHRRYVVVLPVTDLHGVARESVRVTLPEGGS